LESCAERPLRYITTVMGDISPQSTFTATAVFDILDVFVLDYDSARGGTSEANGPSVGVETQRTSAPAVSATFSVGREISHLRPGESEDAARHWTAEAFYWLGSGLQGYHHMRRTRSPVRAIGQRWIGYTLETYLAKQSERTETTWTEILIIGWRSLEQREFFMNTPSHLGVTWETGFEQPLRQSGHLISSERWSFTEHFYQGPQKAVERSTAKRTKRWSRLRKRVASMYRR